MKTLTALILGLGLVLSYSGDAFAQNWDSICKEAGNGTVIAVLIDKKGDYTHHFCGKYAVLQSQDVKIPKDTATIHVTLNGTQWVVLGLNSCILFKNAEGKLEQVCWDDQP